MLLLTCPIGGTLWIGRDIKITLHRGQGDSVMVGLLAPARAPVAVGHSPLPAMSATAKSSAYLFSLPHAHHFTVGAVEVGVEVSSPQPADDGEVDLVHVGVSCPGPIRIGFVAHRDEQIPVVTWHRPPTIGVLH